MKRFLRNATLLSLTTIACVSTIDCAQPVTSQEQCLNHIFNATIRVAKRKKSDINAGILSIYNAIVEKGKETGSKNPSEIITQLDSNIKLGLFNNLTAQDKEVLLEGLFELFLDPNNNASFAFHVDTFSFVIRNGQPLNNCFKLVQNFEKNRDKTKVAEIRKALESVIKKDAPDHLKVNIEKMFDELKLTENAIVQALSKRILNNK